MCLGSIAIGPDPEPYKISPLTSLTRFHYYSFQITVSSTLKFCKLNLSLGGFRSNSLCIPLLFHKCQILRKKYYFDLLNTVHLGSASEKIEFRAILTSELSVSLMWYIACLFTIEAGVNKAKYFYIRELFNVWRISCSFCIDDNLDCGFLACNM
jgi:hypothetical protein